MGLAELETWLRLPVLGLYGLLLFGMSLYGAHRWLLLYLYWRHRREIPRPRARFRDLPSVTVQLPVYNEMYVIERLIEAACRLDYPRDRLEIQVLDDSTDETRAIARRAVARARAAGHPIVHVHRETRTGFKAGALAEGLRRARGELIAVFDADFVPPPDFLQRLVHYFSDPEVGMVQARWGHLNSEHSPLTRVQALLLDGHFVIEHTARHRSGRFFNFNGTAGMWRRRCIEDAGGWQHDTLTEDLDLSYRAQMRGWKFVYLPHVVAPAELPVEMGAFKSQQHRWAKGSIQTARKLLPELLRGPLPWPVKLEAIFHLTANVGYVLMLALALLIVPAVWLRRAMDPLWIAGFDLPVMFFSTASVAAFYTVAHREAGGRPLRALARIPLLMAVGIGLCVNNARAVMEAWLGRASEFHRTPKYNLLPGESPAARRYRAGANRDTWIEALLALYVAAGMTAAAAAGLWGALPFLALFALGFAYTALGALAAAHVPSAVSHRSPASA